MAQHLAKVVLKVNYLMMFGRGGYFDQVIQQYPSDDPRRVHLLVTIPDKHLQNVKTYSTACLILIDDAKKLLEVVTSLAERIIDLEEKDDA